MKKFVSRDIDYLAVVARVTSPLGGETEITCYMPPQGDEEILKELRGMYGSKSKPEILEIEKKSGKMKCPFHDFIKSSIA